MVIDCQGVVTVIVNTCHSGCWNEAAVALGLANDESKITIQADGEIQSQKESESECYRGGYYINSLTGQLYQKYNLFLPRLTLVNSESIIRFQPTNLIPEHVSCGTRTRTTGLLYGAACFFFFTYSLLVCSLIQGL